MTRVRAERRRGLKKGLHRRGTIAVMSAFLLVPLMGLIALGIDYGYLRAVQVDLQRAADAAALAAAQDLAPDASGNQDLYSVTETLREFVKQNVKRSTDFTVLDSDIEIGRYDTSSGTAATIAAGSSGVADAVRVTLRRDNSANGEVPLFFARVIGIPASPVVVTATAYLPPARRIRAGTGILPFSIPVDVWSSQDVGDTWSIYGDGKLTDDGGNPIPGNWGTLDIGASNNSTSDLSNQILDGLRQEDLDALYAEGRIPTNEFIDAGTSFSANGDPGLSSGIKNAVQQVESMTKLVPIYDSVSGQGANVEFHVVGWGAVQVVDSLWGGSKNTYVKIKKGYLYDGHLTAPPDLSLVTGNADGAYAAPVLIE